MIEEGLAGVRDRIETAAKEAGRAPDAVTLVVVSKGRAIPDLEQAYALGVRDFAENRPDELLAKAAALPGDIRWHFVGPLQGNRVRVLHERIHLLHAFDRLDLAEKWADADAPAPVLLQVNIGAEDQKRGLPAAAVPDALATLSAAGVRCTGLMTLPPWASTSEESAPVFKELRALLESLKATYPDLHELSMGTTQDYETAIHHGATLVRVGRAIFGERRAMA